MLILSNARERIKLTNVPVYQKNKGPSKTSDKGSTCTVYVAMWNVST